MNLINWVIEYMLSLGTFSAVAYLTYRAVRPKPLPGIPYNEDAANKLFGDVPEMMGYVMRTKRIFCWLTSLTTRHQSPIAQAFIKPMALPWVILTDPHESQDILLRRTKEFDRSGFFGEVVGGILPEQHIQFLSTDPRFKKNRNLINHLMAPRFITKISAPQIYNSVCTLIKVWKLKCDIAKGHPFSAHNDITYAALDAIFASSFGLPEGESITIQNLKSVETYKADSSGTEDTPISFHNFQIPEVYSAVLTLADSVTNTQLSPAPVLTSWVLRKFPYMKQAAAIKDEYISDKITKSIELIESGDTDPKSAIHSVLLRERDVAAKEGRQPGYYTRAIADEFFGFMIAGHDTSATTVAWGIKYLTGSPKVQDRLRSALHEALPEAAAQGRQPSYGELSKAHIPYLDAVVEEILRHANTIAFVVRRAQQDTTVLGHSIPKGTDVFLMGNGAGYLAPYDLLDKPETNSRSPGARAGSGKALTGLWDNSDIATFRPERWLKTDSETGTEVFDPMAGPTMAFGLGPRGCFGKRLALQHLKIQFSLIIWNFQLLRTPEELSGYNAVQRFAREPTHCYVRLANVD